eukprot:CAMPEP_0197851740 /NCGR_PEP_ID=MMETSP1438-20131217/18737_1 /TAXON_ID=1461541 /ORGANISM="Pterosperma sp., Strain CCMP1384" /LENGTH=57 /DNA_ID=CAMNT_0043465457 /DNA_START=171 /DNA_END=341 /DNA_ORIENTATION=-
MYTGSSTAELGADASSRPATSNLATVGTLSSTNQKGGIMAPPPYQRSQTMPSVPTSG